MLEEAGQDVPALQDRPKLTNDLEHIVRAFESLSMSRTSNGFGLNPLSMADIKAYYDFGLSPLEPETFIFLIQSIDQAYLDEYNETHRNS
ncbi:phage tail assembly chaperone [Idiomarina piscisalsi]|uniref:Uncharacterized protein n=1 Tax=Idiomarina piscisalsi TaxID=1096243 RepID=A0A432YXD7_9GAMM|nr:hypothetical protein CWI73_03800 [Idiomarina piscisalsi]